MKVGDLQFCFGLPRIDIFLKKKKKAHFFFLSKKKRKRDTKIVDKKAFKKSIFKYLKRCD